MSEQVAQEIISENCLVTVPPTSAVLQTSGLASESRSGQCRFLSLSESLPHGSASITQGVHGSGERDFFKLQSLFSAPTPICFQRNCGFMTDHCPLQPEISFFHRNLHGSEDLGMGLHQSQMELSHDKGYFGIFADSLHEANDQSLTPTHSKSRRGDKSKRSRQQSPTCVGSKQEPSRVTEIYETYPSNNIRSTLSQVNPQGWLSKSSRRSSCEEVIPSSPMVRRRRRLTADETEYLTERFLRNEKPDRKERFKMAQDLSLDPRIVQVWFQNRRAKIKRDDSMARDFALVEQDFEYEYECEIKGRQSHEETSLCSVDESGLVYEATKAIDVGDCLNAGDITLGSKALMHKPMDFQRLPQEYETQGFVNERIEGYQWMPATTLPLTDIPSYACQDIGPDTFVGYCCPTMSEQALTSNYSRSHPQQILCGRSSFTTTTTSPKITPRGTNPCPDQQDSKAETPFQLPSFDFDLDLGLQTAPGWEYQDLGFPFPLSSSIPADSPEVETATTNADLEHVLGILTSWRHEQEQQAVNDASDKGATTVHLSMPYQTEEMTAPIPASLFCSSESHADAPPKPFLRRRRLRQNPIPRHQQALTLITPSIAAENVK